MVRRGDAFASSLQQGFSWAASKGGGPWYSVFSLGAGSGSTLPASFSFGRGSVSGGLVVFFDPSSWKEVGVFIERPEAVTELRARKRREIFAAHPEFGSPDAPPDQLPEDVRARLQQELQKMRDDTVDQANAEVVRELRAIAEGTATRGGARQLAGV